MGRLRWERWVDTGIFDGSGRLLELQSTGRDITDQKNGELALRESEARYRAVVEGQTEFILRLDPDGNLTFVNDAYCRYRGLARETLLGGFNDIAHYPPEQQERIRAAWAGLTPDTPSVTYELVKPCVGGGSSWEEWTDTAVFAPDGRIIENPGDRARRHRAQAGRAVAARQRGAVPADRRERAAADRDHRRRPLSRSCSSMPWGARCSASRRATTDPQEIARIWADGDQRAEIARLIESEGRVEQAEVRMRRRDGSEFDAILSARPLDYGGERAVLGVITDITERSRMEEALRESEARLVALMDNAPLVVHLKDRSGRYLLANPESAKIFGRDPAEVIGRTAAEIFPAKEAAFIDRHHQEVLRTGRTHFYEEHQPSLDAYQWSIVIRFPIRDVHGEVAVVGCFALDITERKRAEAALKASEARLAAFMENAPVGDVSQGPRRPLPHGQPGDGQAVRPARRRA